MATRDRSKAKAVLGGTLGYAAGLLETRNQAAAELDTVRPSINGLKAGVYGDWVLAWENEDGETPDMDAIKEVFENELHRKLPMKPQKPSMKITPLAGDTPAQQA